MRAASLLGLFLPVLLGAEVRVSNGSGPESPDGSRARRPPVLSARSRSSAGDAKTPAPASAGTSPAFRRSDGKGVTDRMRSVLAAGGSLDLLVRFDAGPADTATDGSRDRQAALRNRVARYAAGKRRAIEASLLPGEYELLREYENLPVSFMRFRSAAALLRFVDRPDIVGVTENRTYEKHLTQSLPLIGQPTVAAAGLRGAGVTVAVLDTGVDFTRSAFGSCPAAGSAGCKVSFAQDFAPDDGQRDADGHGTNVAGIVLGVAPDAKIAALDVFDGDLTHGDALVAAADWCIANAAVHNIVAMNMSLGGGEYFTPCPDPVGDAIVADLRAAGVLTVASSGNDGYLGAIGAPACTPGVLSVGAVYDANIGPASWSACTDGTTRADQVACFSNSASFLTLLAPGALINAAGESMGGTSQAAPHVSGAVAVLRAAYPTETLTDTVEYLVGNAPQIVDPGNGLPKPRLDLARAADDPQWGCTAVGMGLPSLRTGTLRSDDCHDASQDSGSIWYVDVYSFAGTAGQAVTIDLRSDDFDAWVGLIDPSGDMVASDDDTFGTDSRIQFTLDQSGTWEIYVESFWSHESGDYELELWSGPGGGPSCTPTSEALCLNDNRFRVTADWRRIDGSTGRGTAVPLTEDTGYFWFFNASNIEVVTKVLRACTNPFNSYWVFAAGLTNVEVTLRYRDTVSGLERTYQNPLGTAFAPIQDTSAFATCP